MVYSPPSSRVTRLFWNAGHDVLDLVHDEVALEDLELGDVATGLVIDEDERPSGRRDGDRVTAAVAEVHGHPHLASWADAGHGRYP